MSRDLVKLEFLYLLLSMRNAHKWVLAKGGYLRPLLENKHTFFAFGGFVRLKLKIVRFNVVQDCTFKKVQISQPNSNNEEIKVRLGQRKRMQNDVRYSRC